MTTQSNNTKSYRFELPEGITLNGFESDDATITRIQFESTEEQNVGGYPTAFNVTSEKDTVVAKISITSSVPDSISSASTHVTLDLSGSTGWSKIEDLSTYPNDIPIIVGSNKDAAVIPINVGYTRQYLLAPGVQIESAEVLDQASGYFTSSGNIKHQVSASGGTVSTAPTAVTFNVYGSGPYFTAKIKLNYYETKTSKKTTSTNCLITFKLSGEKWWEEQGSTILNPPSGKTGTLPIVPPSGNTGAGPETLNKEMVYLLDVSSEGNFLFRGNSPLAGSDKPIDFQTLDKYLREQYKYQSNGVASPKPLPALGKYALCEIALLSTASEAYEIAYSVASYGSKNTQKSLQQKITKGHATSVANLASGSTPYPADAATTLTDANGTEITAEMYLWQVQPGDFSYDIDHGKRIYHMVNSKSTITVEGEVLPIVYYIHCCNGHDRTGIVSSIYMIEKSNHANPGTNSDTDLTEQYIRGTTINRLTADMNGPQLYTECTYYSGSKQGQKAEHKSRCFLIHAASDPTFLYRKTVEDAYNTIKNNDSSTAKSIDSKAEQGYASTAVYVMDDPSPVPSQS